MLNGRIAAVALSGAVFIACTNTEPSPPPDLETYPQRAPSEKETRGAAAGDGREETAELEPEEPAAETAEEALPGAPQNAPSTSPLCGTGLACSATSVAGSAACRLQASSVGDVYCCPRRSERIVNGRCVATICGSGLVCAASPTSGASACRQTTSSPSDIFCCPSGKSIVAGRCQ